MSNLSFREIGKEIAKKVSKEIEKNDNKLPFKLVDQHRVEEALKLVNQLDFSLMRRKMIEYNGLDEKFVDRAISEYKNFLALLVAYKDIYLGFVPNDFIDEAWHQHILDTRGYYEDCMLLFGEIIHHDPYLGLRGSSDIEKWENTSYITAYVYNYHFGKKIFDDVIARGCSAQACWAGKDK
jgi:hypothetical protein